MTTKFGSKKPGQTVKDVLKTELADLKLEYVDLYLIHTPEPFQGKLGALWKEFEELKKEGLTKEIGISNFRVGDLEELLESIQNNGGEVPAVHQAGLDLFVDASANASIDRISSLSTQIQSPNT